jgi:hypothetical protein
VNAWKKGNHLPGRRKRITLSSSRQSWKTDDAIGASSGDEREEQRTPGTRNPTPTRETARQYIHHGIPSPRQYRDREGHHYTHRPPTLEGDTRKTEEKADTDTSSDEDDEYWLSQERPEDNILGEYLDLPHVYQEIPEDGTLHFFPPEPARPIGWGARIQGTGDGRAALPPPPSAHYTHDEHPDTRSASNNTEDNQDRWKKGPDHRTDTRPGEEADEEADDDDERRNPKSPEVRHLREQKRPDGSTKTRQEQRGLEDRPPPPGFRKKTRHNGSRLPGEKGRKRAHLLPHPCVGRRGRTHHQGPRPSQHNAQYLPRSGWKGVDPIPPTGIG